MDWEAANDWNRKRRKPKGEPMSAREEAKRVTLEKIEALEKHIKYSILPDCKQQGRKTEAYRNATKDMAKLKAELEQGEEPTDALGIKASKLNTKAFLDSRKPGEV